MAMAMGIVIRCNCSRSALESGTGSNPKSTPAELEHASLLGNMVIMSGITLKPRKPSHVCCLRYDTEVSVNP